jgi:hypothetical protein
MLLEVDELNLLLLDLLIVKISLISVWFNLLLKFGDLLLHTFILVFESISLSFEVFILINLLSLSHYFLLKAVDLRLMAFCFKILLYLCFEHIPFVLESSSFSSGQIFSFNLSFKFNKLLFLFIFQITEIYTVVLFVVVIHF